jgi:anaerobic selenocysteine-containing dehydrogenase/Fe-S cluster biogenesis protein NfuA
VPDRGRCNPPCPEALTPAELVRLAAADPAVLEAPATRARHHGLLERSSVCSYCGVGCPYTVETDGRGVDKVQPLSDLGLCVKGRTSLETGGDEARRSRLEKKGLADDRVRVPMIRGHDGQMKAVSWDEALDRAAWLFLHAREWVGPEAAAIYGNGQKTVESIWLACLYKLVFRLPTIGANSEHCLASAGAAHELNFGNEASFTWREFEELARCDVAVLHGTNAFVTFPQAYEKLARNRAARKVVIDPVRTDTVSELEAVDPRTLHIRFRQGGDVAFNLAVSRVILERGWQDAAFLARAVDPESVAALSALCMEPRFTPEAVAEAFALPGQPPAELAATIREYASLIAEPGPDGHRPRVAFVSSMGINQSTGAYGFSTNLNLLLLTGNVGREGAGSLRIAGQSNATSELMLGFNGRRMIFNLDPDDPEHRARVAAALDLPEHNIPTTAGTPVARMSEDDKLYCFLFIGTQMTRNMPRLGHWMRRLGRAFNVVIDPFLAPGALEWADVLLPSLTYTERTGVIQRGDRSLQLQQALTAPPPAAWSDEQILVRLALAIAHRLRDPDTAALNDLDPDVVERVFGRYVRPDGRVDTSEVFAHMVSVSRALGVYCRLEDGAGEPLSHAGLRQRAGRGVQWQGDGRYRDAGEAGAVFPNVPATARRTARLVRPPEEFLARLATPMPEGTLGLISGRGRPGVRARFMRGRYNSGIKTLPITGAASEDYLLDLHPEEAARQGFVAGQPVRVSTAHGTVFATVGTNDRVPPGSAFIDFVPGEINRLTDYVDADRFTNQSFIKRTPVRLAPLGPGEAALWAQPDGDALAAALAALRADLRLAYPEDAGWIRDQQEGRTAWLPPEVLRSGGPVASAAGAFTVFIQRLSTDAEYREGAQELLGALSPEAQDNLLTVLLPFLRRFDYQSAMHLILSGVVGPVKLVDEAGAPVQVDLLSAHRSAILEFKEEIVAIQLFVAIKRAMERLFGPGAVVRRDQLAFVSGVAIPCAGDVPAHFLGISPAELGAGGLVHSRAIGNSALIVVDTSSGRAVRVDVTTGVLPHDPELTKLRGLVINRKRGCDGRDHRRFFDRLGELICEYVRRGDGNYALFGPVPLDWEEYRAKLNYAPPKRSEFLHHLVRQQASPGLIEALVGLGVINAEQAPRGESSQVEVRPAAPSRLEGLEDLPLPERVSRVVEEVIAPVLRNDGGKLEILGLDEALGELQVRFVGSCANCPYSLLSMEQLVRPTLLAIPGIHAVRHRAQPRDSELAKAGGQAAGPARRGLPLVSAESAR